MGASGSPLPLRPTPEISISTQLTIIPLRIVLKSSFISSPHAFPLFVSEENHPIFLSATPLLSSTLCS